MKNHKFKVGQEVRVNGAWGIVEKVTQDGCYVSDQDGGEEFYPFSQID